MKKLLLSLMVVGVMLASLATFVMAAPGGATDPGVLKDLAAARRATAKYHDVTTALDDGYISTIGCVEVPGLGVMGIHYINPRLMPPPVDLSTPEVLLYVPTENGVRLVGVEYFFPIGAPGAPVPDPAPPAPIIFGRAMNGPMPGHEPSQPPHYDLHVWLWEGNPDGTFADFNPNVRCP